MERHVRRIRALFSALLLRTDCPVAKATQRSLLPDMYRIGVNLKEASFELPGALIAANSPERAAYQRWVETHRFAIEPRRGCASAGFASLGLRQCDLHREVLRNNYGAYSDCFLCPNGRSGRAR